MRECTRVSADAAQASQRDLKVTRFVEEQIMAHEILLFSLQCRRSFVPVPQIARALLHKALAR
jgi:hypothetical protein